MQRSKRRPITRRTATAAGALLLSASLGVLASACGGGASGSPSGGGAPTHMSHNGNSGPTGSNAGSNAGSGGVSF